MKNAILGFILLNSINAMASQDFQMKKILGDWRIKGEAVLRIYQQSDNSIKMLWCDEDEYLNSSNKHCSYSFIKIYTFRSDLDSFFSPKGQYCSESLQVSTQYTSDLVRVINPYFINEGCDATGETSQARKL